MLARILVAAIAACVFAASASAEELTGTLKKIKDSGTITLGFREASPPFSILGDDGKPVGYSIDLCARVVGAVKQELGLDDLKVNYVPVNPTNRIDRVKSGAVDLECGSTTDTFTRQQDVDFTYLTFVTGTVMLAKTHTNVSTLADLAGQKVGVARGTTTERTVSKRIQSKFINAEIVLVDDHDEGLRALESDKITAYASDRVVLIGLAQRSAQRNQLMLTEEALSYEPYALMLRRDDSAFRRVANRALSRVYTSGDIVGMFQKWFGKLGLKPTPMLQALYILQARPE
ncbi:MAG: amino acid ABC transporter substrate-binding protein [Alphaproteobacteria bacterium]|nr:amino acid ABC transporter substrate-binding protein [Alphaproteobacteria bacterium]